ncbi:2078_t:CDS:1, partial [Dentiscutata heterogama]
KLIMIFENFHENKIKLSLELNNMNYAQSDKFNNANEVDITNSDKNNLEHGDKNKVFISSKHKREKL